MTKKKKVLIIGGGFGGVAVARGLTKRKDLDITIIDRSNHHLFQPLLYQVATASLSPAQIAYPIRSMFRFCKNTTVLIGHVCDVDLDGQKVSLNKSNQKFEYDYLIVASGARHAYFGHPEWEKHAWGLKTMKDALMIRERMLYSLEKAERTRFEDKRKRFSTFVIVGAGPTGVEMAGAITEVTRKSLAGDFNRFDPRNSRIILIEGSDRVLNRYPEKLSQKAQAGLEKMGVEVMLNSIVTNVTAEGVQVGEQFIETENVIWAAGNMASPLVKAVTNDINKVGQANVNPDFSTKENANVFCIGDCAYLEDQNKVVVPAVAQGAIQAGKFVAKQIIHDLDGKTRGAFSYLDKGKMATIGRSRAVADLGFIQFSGFPAWVLWGFIHILFLVDFRSKFIVFLEWANSYITHKRSVRLINVYREKN